MWQHHTVPRHRYRRGPVGAYGRALGSLLLCLTVTFVLYQAVIPRIVDRLLESARPSLAEITVAVHAGREAVGFGVDQPTVHRYAEFLVTRLAYEPILAFVLGGAVVTAVLTARRAS